ncbi:MAG: hypothetical protein ACLR2E_23750 [Lachnospiraceae bacterium]
MDTFVDYTSNTAGIQFHSSATAGQSFYKSSGTWKDMTSIGNKSAVARIKAFTKNTAAAVTPGTGSASSSTVSLSTPRIKSYLCPGYNSVSLPGQQSAAPPAIRSTGVPLSMVLIHGFSPRNAPVLPIPRE